MARYTTRPTQAVRMPCDEFEWAGTEPMGLEVHDTGDWSRDQPTGILTADGHMIYRTARRIGFMADN